MCLKHKFPISLKCNSLSCKQLKKLCFKCSSLHSSHIDSVVDMNDSTIMIGESQEIGGDLKEIGQRQKKKIIHKNQDYHYSHELISILDRWNLNYGKKSRDNVFSKNEEDKKERISTDI